MSIDLDVLIVGGGLTGCALALALRDWPGRVGLVETQLPVASNATFDERHLGLSLASVEALGGLGVWSRIVEATQPIAAIHVCSQGEFGSVRLTAENYGLKEFGRVCPARALGLALNSAIAEVPQLQLFRPARLLEARTLDGALEVRLESAGSEQLLRTRLLVGADGTDSLVRRLAGLQTEQHDYEQTAIVSNIETSQPHAGLAFERLTRHGPLALLPLPGRRCGVVWTQQSAAASARMGLDDGPFVSELQQAFGYRLGRINRIGRRQAWPLKLVRTLSATNPDQRMVLIGNAAQTIHPIGAQGFNLGLRDALGLATAVSAARDPGAVETIARFEQSRKPDRDRTVTFSDGLVQASGSASWPARLLRSAALLSLDALAPLKRQLVHFGTGYGRA